jgi:hypothetical protein
LVDGRAGDGANVLGIGDDGLFDRETVQFSFE